MFIFWILSILTCQLHYYLITEEGLEDSKGSPSAMHWQ